MSYTKVNWDENTPISANNLDQMDQGIKNNNEQTQNNSELIAVSRVVPEGATFAEIEQIIQDVHNAGGGSVVFPAGEWEESGTISLVDIQNVAIRGQGQDVTKIISTNDTSIYIHSNCEDLEVSNCTISGDFGHGLNNSGSNIKISNCTISGDDGLYNSGSNIKISNCTISGDDGIYDTSDSTDIADAAYYIGNDVTGGIIINGNAIVADTSSPTYANLNRDELTE